jgi:hypothetical protein
MKQMRPEGGWTYKQQHRTVDKSFDSAASAPMSPPAASSASTSAAPAAVTASPHLNRPHQPRVARPASAGGPGTRISFSAASGPSKAATGAPSAPRQGAPLPVGRHTGRLSEAAQKRPLRPSTASSVSSAGLKTPERGPGGMRAPVRTSTAFTPGSAKPTVPRVSSAFRPRPKSGSIASAAASAPPLEEISATAPVAASASASKGARIQKKHELVQKANARMREQSQ